MADVAQRQIAVSALSSVTQYVMKIEQTGRRVPFTYSPICGKQRETKKIDICSQREIHSTSKLTSTTRSQRKVKCRSVAATCSTYWTLYTTGPLAPGMFIALVSKVLFFFNFSKSICQSLELIGYEKKEILLFFFFLDFKICV